MARYIYQGTYKDGNGRRIDSATVSVYLAGTSTAASVYAASSGGSPVNSVTTDSRGSFEFYVDDTDYTQDQLFKITMSKTGFQSSSYDDIVIFPKNRIILDGSNNFYIDGRTSTRQITLGAMRQEHTAGIAGTRAYHIDVKPNGFDDTNCLVARLDLDGGSESIRPKCLNLNVDITGATNAHINLLEAAKTGDRDASVTIDAIDVRPGVNPIHQYSGTIGAIDQAFKYDASGASYTDVTANFSSAASDVTLFDEDSDVIYLGHASQFDTIEVILATVASNPGIKPTFEYSKGAGVWGSLPVSDDTNGFRENGNIFYALPSDWATDTVNAVTTKYWVRITRASNNVSTIPVEDTIKVVSSSEFQWDENGDLTVNDITAAAVTTSGILTANSLQIDDTSADHQYIFAVNELSADRTITLPLLTGNDTFVFNDFAATLANKTLTTPTIASFVNANHDHSNSAGGGTITQSGITRQVVNTQDGAVATGTTTIPNDDTIPQNTEGDQYMTLAITPKSATNKLKIDVIAHAANSAATGTITAALFQDTTADALAVSAEWYDAANSIVPLAFTHYMTSGTTSATTFKIRIGNSAAGTTTFNGWGGARKFGGVFASSITITEIQV